MADFTTEAGKPVPTRARAKDWAYEVKVPAPPRQGQPRKLLLMCLTWHVNVSMVAWPSWKLLEQRSQMSRTSIYRHLGGLHDSGLIVTIPSYRNAEGSGGRSSNVYVINVDGWLDDVDRHPDKVRERLRHLEQLTETSNTPLGRVLRP